MNKRSQERLVDSLIDAYVSWREACLQVSDAYGSWGSETGLGATSAFGRYMAALDREERAVEVYAGLVRRAGRLALSRHGPAEPLGGVGSCTGPARVLRPDAGASTQASWIGAPTRPRAPGRGRRVQGRDIAWEVRARSHRRA